LGREREAWGERETERRGAAASYCFTSFYTMELGRNLLLDYIFTSGLLKALLVKIHIFTSSPLKDPLVKIHIFTNVTSLRDFLEKMGLRFLEKI
jgi:hypothetical protein